MEREEQEFLGIVLFTYEDCMGIDSETMQYYDVDFPFQSMKKYNGRHANLYFEGWMEVINDKGKILWEGYTTDIEEFRNSLFTVEVKYIRR